MLLSQNSKGHISKQLSILISKKMKEAAQDCEEKVKIEIRNELDKQHKADIYNSFAPIHQSGKDVDKYNRTHTHQKKHPYHHSGLLLRSVHAEIDEDVVKIVIDDNEYDDGTSVRDVYEWLDKGTKDSEHDYYILGGKGSHTPLVPYVKTPRHGFKQDTLRHMDGFIQNTIIPNIDKGKYLRKTRKGAK